MNNLYSSNRKKDFVDLEEVAGTISSFEAIEEFAHLKSKNKEKSTEE